MGDKGIRYRFAAGPDGKPVDAADLALAESFDSDSFKCLQCERVMNARVRGTKQRPHFGHRAGADCPFASYVEKAATRIVADSYNRLVESGEVFLLTLTGPKYCYKFQDVLGRPCDTGRRYSDQHDIRKFYGEATLNSMTDEWFLELSPMQDHLPPLSIVVSYQDPHKGKGRDFGDKRVIEILLRSEDELEELKHGRFGGVGVQFHNLKREPIAATDDECACKFTRFTLAIVYESGKCFFETNALESLAQKLRQQQRKTKLYTLVPAGESHWATMTHALRQLRDEGRDVRHCLLCESYARKLPTPSGKSGYCLAKERFAESNEGATCPQFVLGTQFQREDKRARQ